MASALAEHLLEAVVVSELTYLTILNYMLPQSILFVRRGEDITNYIVAEGIKFSATQTKLRREAF